MAVQKLFTTKRRYLLMVAGLAVFLLFLYLFVPFTDLIAAVKKINLFYFFLAFCALLASVALSSLAWERLLGLLSVKTSFLKAFKYVWVENFVDLVIPGEPVSGELSRIYLMSKDTGGNYGNVVASAVGQRLAVTSVTVVGLFSSIAYFASVYKPPLLVLGFTSVVLLADVFVVVLLFYLATTKDATRKLANWLFALLTRISRGHWKFEHLKERVMQILDIFHEGISLLRVRRKSLVLPILLIALSWLSEMSISVLVFYSLGFAGTAISPSAIIIVYCISGAIQYLPIGIIPGEAGLTEIIMTTLFTLLGSPQFIGVFAIATVLIRALTFWARLLISGSVVQLIGIKNLLPSQTPQTGTPATPSKSSQPNMPSEHSFP